MRLTCPYISRVYRILFGRRMLLLWTMRLFMSRMVTPGAKVIIESLMRTRRPLGGHMAPIFASWGILRRRSTGAPGALGAAFVWRSIRGVEDSAEVAGE